MSMRYGLVITGWSYQGLLNFLMSTTWRAKTISYLCGKSYKLICMFFYTATTTNELCHSGVHNCPHNCLGSLIYYTTKWLTVATIIPFEHGSGSLRMYAFLTQASNFFQISSLYRDYLVHNKLSITYMLQGYQRLFFCHIAIILPI